MALHIAGLAGGFTSGRPTGPTCTPNSAASSFDRRDVVLVTLLELDGRDASVLEKKLALDH